MPSTGSAGGIPADAASLLALLQSPNTMGGAQAAGSTASTAAAAAGALGAISSATPYGAAADLAGKALSASGDSGPTSATSGSNGSQKASIKSSFGDFIVNKGSGSVSTSPSWLPYAMIGGAVLIVGFLFLRKA